MRQKDIILDESPSKVQNIQNAFVPFKSREIKRNDFIVPNEILKDKQKFYNLVNNFHIKLSDYASRLQVSTSTLAITLRYVFQYHPNYRFTYDELFNYLVRALEKKDIFEARKDIESERVLKTADTFKATNLVNKDLRVNNLFKAEPTTITRSDIGSIEDKFDKYHYIQDHPNYPKQIQNNQNFASWLLNNRIALASMLSKRDFTSTLVVALNPAMINKSSPMFLAQLVALVSQLLKLRQGKVQGSVEAQEEEKLDEAEKDLENVSADHKHRIVDEVKNVINIIPLKSVKDFLLEAERFVEEEIAMFYSFQKSLEKEILKQINKKKE